MWIKALGKKAFIQVGSIAISYVWLYDDHYHIDCKVGGLTELVCIVCTVLRTHSCKAWSYYDIYRGFGGVSPRKILKIYPPEIWSGSILMENCEAVNVVLATCTVTKYATLASGHLW